MNTELDITTTYQAILEAAKERRFISYGELTKANGVDWQSHRYEVFRQLGELIHLAAARGWPLASAIVVNQSHLQDGVLEGSARKGFITAAADLGFNVSDPDAFIAEQQKAVFAWSQTAPDELALTEEESASLARSAPRSPSGSGPRFVRLLGPVLEAMQALGGEAEPKQVFDEVAKSDVVSEQDLKETNKNGLSKYENQVGWARFYLTKAGLMESKKRGVWQLTAEGRETTLDQEAALSLFREVHARYKSTDADTDDEIAPPQEPDISDLFADPSPYYRLMPASGAGSWRR